MNTRLRNGAKVSRAIIDINIHAAGNFTVAAHEADDVAVEAKLHASKHCLMPST